MKARYFLTIAGYRKKYLAILFGELGKTTGLLACEIENQAIVKEKLGILFKHLAKNTGHLACRTERIAYKT